MDQAAPTAQRPTPLPEARAYCPTTTFGKVFDEGALLVDVREPNEFAALAFDAPEVLHVPLSAFERRFAELPRNRELILACAGGGRSLKATYFLMFHGYMNVANLSGGIHRWSADGFPVHGSFQSMAAVGGCCSTPAAAQAAATAGGDCCGDGGCGC